MREMQATASREVDHRGALRLMAGSLLPQVTGKHRRDSTSRYRPSGMRVIVVVVVAALAVAVTFAALPQHASARRAAATGGVAVPARHLTASRLSASQARELRDLTPAQEQRLENEIKRGFSQLGFHVGFGASGSATTPGRVSLAAYDWSGGVTWSHAWLTASYANLAAAANRVNGVTSKYRNLFGLVSTVGCGFVGGWIGGMICGELAYGISEIAAELSSLPYITNHGIWAAYYWYGNYWTGGYW